MKCYLIRHGITEGNNALHFSGSGTDAAPSVGAVAGQVNNNVAVAGKKNAVFTNITSNVDITLASQTQQPRAGGLFGQMYLAVVENCVNNGNLTTDASNVARLGGFTGQFIRCTFKGCVNNGKVTASTTGSKGVNIAGFAAYCTGPAKEADESVSDRYSVIENCINNGEISGTAEGNVAVAVGGIVGNFYTAVKENYLDRLVVLSRGPYSNVSASEAGCGEKEWLVLSDTIRRYHELTHVICRRLYPDDIDAVRDELIADAVGIPKRKSCSSA